MSQTDGGIKCINVILLFKKNSFLHKNMQKIAGEAEILQEFGITIHR